MPYITSSIVVQLATSLSPQLAAIKKEGESGRKKLNQYTRYLTVVLAVFQAYGISIGLEGRAGASADRRRVLADARCEYEAVNAAHGRRQHSGEESDPVDEIVEREFSPGVGAHEQVPDVVADAGEALETAFMIEKVLDLARAHALFGQKVEHDARVELARRFHNDVVRSCLQLRRKRVVRWFRLAGYTPMPTTADFDDTPPAGLAGR